MYINKGVIAFPYAYSPSQLNWNAIYDIVCPHNQTKIMENVESAMEKGEAGLVQGNLSPIPTSPTLCNSSSKSTKSLPPESPPKRQICK